MLWLDVAGSPGSGKSALFDRRWPRKIGESEPLAEWGEFLAVAHGLVTDDECRTILNHYARKVAAVSCMSGKVYANTGLAQAGLEIGWRGGGVSEYFRLMPVSLGVLFLWADAETLKARNRARGRDRSHMIDGMERTRKIATVVLVTRGVPVFTLDTRDGIEVSHRKIAEALCECGA